MVLESPVPLTPDAASILGYSDVKPVEICKKMVHGLRLWAVFLTKGFVPKTTFYELCVTYVSYDFGENGGKCVIYIKFLYDFFHGPPPGGVGVVGATLGKMTPKNRKKMRFF